MFNPVVSIGFWYENGLQVLHLDSGLMLEGRMVCCFFASNGRTEFVRLRDLFK